MSDDHQHEDIVLDDEPEIVEQEGQSARMKRLRVELAEAKKSRDEYLTGWQKSKADYINFKNEQETLRKDLSRHVRIACVGDLLPVLDSFDMAMANEEAWNAVDDNWRVGVEYIHQQLRTLLADYGVESIDQLGVFDPELHEPVGSVQVADAASADQVTAVEQRGYRMGETIIRPAKVTVSVHTAVTPGTD